MPTQQLWTRDELLLALRLYMRTEFGRLHQRKPEIVALAAAIGRTPSAVAMKACNFASLDPALEQSGLSSASQADRDIWAEFHANPEALANEAEAAVAAMTFEVDTSAEDTTEAPIRIPEGPTDAETIVRTRRVQSFFRGTVLVTYNSRCALTGLSVPSLLVASHIIPWSADVARRADPTNGVCLSALLDRAFDRGLITFDEDYRVVLSRALKESLPQPHLPCLLSAAEGVQLQIPQRFPPDMAALHYHRAHVFCG